MVDTAPLAIQRCCSICSTSRGTGANGCEKSFFPWSERFPLASVCLWNTIRLMDTNASDSSFDPYRSYLKLLARTNVNALMRRKLDASDIVRQTLLKAASCAGRLLRRRSWLCELFF